MNGAQTLANILDFTLLPSFKFTRKLLHSLTYQRSSLAYSKLVCLLSVENVFFVRRGQS